MVEQSLPKLLISYRQELDFISLSKVQILDSVKYFSLTGMKSKVVVNLSPECQNDE
jgi:hypothetical protein